MCSSKDGHQGRNPLPGSHRRAAVDAVNGDLHRYAAHSVMAIFYRREQLEECLLKLKATLHRVFYITTL